MDNVLTILSEAKPFKGLRGDQQFVPGICFDDGNMRVMDDGKWWVVEGRTMRLMSEDEYRGTP